MPENPAVHDKPNGPYGSSPHRYSIYGELSDGAFDYLGSARALNEKAALAEFLSDPETMEYPVGMRFAVRRRTLAAQIVLFKLEAPKRYHIVRAV